jgi:hypothetical protein
MDKKRFRVRFFDGSSQDIVADGWRFGEGFIHFLNGPTNFQSHTNYNSFSAFNSSQVRSVEELIEPEEDIIHHPV